MSVADVRSLATEANTWELGGHHGILVLQKEQRYLLGLNGFHWCRFSEIILVRRQAAARLLRKLGFNYSVTKELPLFTKMRIIHCNDQTEDIPLEHFITSDSEKKNPFITTEDEKDNCATWDVTLEDMETNGGTVYRPEGKTTNCATWVQKFENL